MPHSSAATNLRSVPKIRHRPPGRRLWAILRSLARDSSRERISIGDLLDTLHDRAFGALIFIFAFPNILPTPPGTSAILAAPLVFLTAQMMLGRKPWLPGFIANRSMARKDFASMTERVVPWLARAERLLRPRLMILASPPIEYIVGAICFLLAAVLLLPIPLGNMLPAFAICLFSLGILGRDGIWIVLGLIATIISAIVVSGVVYALLKSAIFIISNTFG
ncbi:exopolysaccharide biosynthesis protein [Pseudochelatococcus sp. G4_1912]|uniref:exopolysaccharide biosynthesis protein n=1 Tax=Pseudochelatococcus sp. G4_1912 TaxID=3114288 RepID=UPI0039C6F4A4